jgi:hypothetical protein
MMRNVFDEMVAAGMENGGSSRWPWAADRPCSANCRSHGITLLPPPADGALVTGRIDSIAARDNPATEPDDPYRPAGATHQVHRRGMLMIKEFPT